MEEKQKKIYYHSALTMRLLVESINEYQIHASDIVLVFHDGQSYIVVYEL